MNTTQQERGEVRSHGGARNIKFPDEKLEINPKQIQEAGNVHDAEKAEKLLASRPRHCATSSQMTKIGERRASRASHESA